MEALKRTNLLQERLEELVSAIINLKNDKVYVDGFYNDIMLNKWLKGLNCRMSMGMYEMNEYDIDFSRIPDKSLVIINQDDNEIARYQYMPFYKGVVRFDNDNCTDSKSKTLSRVFMIRKCKYTRKYNLIINIEKENSALSKICLTFESIDDIEKHFQETFKNYKIYQSDKGILKGGFQDVRKYDID